MGTSRFNIKAFPINSLESHIHALPSQISTIYTNLLLSSSNQKSLLDGSHITISGSATHTDKVEASEELQGLRLQSSRASAWFSLGLKVKSLGDFVVDF
jgi:hypothetical protein